MYNQISVVVVLITALIALFSKLCRCIIQFFLKIVEMVTSTPIWNFETNEAVETDKVDLKPFKATGKFFPDAQTLVGIFKVVTHPALRESSYRQDRPGNNSSATADN